MTDLDDTTFDHNGLSSTSAKVLMNLVINAFDAIKAEGTVTVKIAKVSLTRLDSGYDKINPGDYVMVRVSDTGCGISEEDLTKIFEPYYSKKKMGRSGTGLGLSVVYGIVQDHAGYYDVLSEVGRGTDFVLYFPVTEKAISRLESRSQARPKNASCG